MNTLASQTRAAARRVRVTDQAIAQELVDGRTVSVDDLPVVPPMYGVDQPASFHHVPLVQVRRTEHAP
jgi:hypothetical protein